MPTLGAASASSDAAPAGTASPSAAPNSIEIRHVTKRFADFVAVDDVSLDITRGEFFSLLGPSGCGKTTLLRMIGGFEQPSAGTIFIDGIDLTGVPPYKRPVNMVFQHYALFPHLTVAENVAFGLRYQGVPRSAEKQRAADALGLVQLSGLSDRYPHQLSGGQRQRVALARALVLEPKVLLLDEPLGALDQKLRKEVQVELKNLQRRLGITFVFVTHDQEEALTMSDRIAVMNRGRVEQVASSPRVFEYPETEFVAQFMGASNFFTATVREIGEGLLSLSLLGGTGLKVKAPDEPLSTGDRVRFVVRPEKLDLRGRDLSSQGIPSVPVVIEDRIYQGISTVWVVRDPEGGRFFIYDQNERPFEEMSNFAVGGNAFMCWSPRHAVVVSEAVNGSPASPAP